MSWRQPYRIANTCVTVEHGTYRHTLSTVLDIRNTRQIASVYLRGVKLDREALLARWRGANTTQSRGD